MLETASRPPASPLGCCSCPNTQGHLLPLLATSLPHPPPLLPLLTNSVKAQDDGASSSFDAPQPWPDDLRRNVCWQSRAVLCDGTRFLSLGSAGGFPYCKLLWAFWPSSKKPLSLSHPASHHQSANQLRHLHKHNTPSDANPIFEPNHPHFHTHSPTHSQTFTRKPGVLGDSKTPPSMRASHPAKIISPHLRQNNHIIHISKRLNRAQHNSTTTNKLQHHSTYLEHPKPTPTRS